MPGASRSLFSARLGLLALAAALSLVVPGHGARAQTEAVATPILTIDQEQMFRRSLWGKRLQDELDAASAELSAENRRIEAELVAEERRLTEQRPGMEPSAFRALSEAFDSKVTEIRRTQDQKARELARRPDEERAAFFRTIVPILAEIVRERRALAILDSRSVLLSADIIDITDEAVERIDARIGDGAGPVRGPSQGTVPGTSEGQPAAPP